jgi:RHS repeat-associated protein
MEGAGGIGGLLARSDGYSGGNWSTHNYYHADGNGNITYLVNSGQTVAASYRYDPFGNLISSSGTYASANLYRFSSKEVHVASGMYYYLYRFYDPNLQRWINRDPIGEIYDVGLYRFVYNEPINRTDPDGLGPNGSPGYGAGKLCTSKNCNTKKCPVKYLPEDETRWKNGFLDMPAPGKCADADAVARPGEYLKIPDNCRVTVECYSEDSWKHDGTAVKGGLRGFSWTCWGLGPIAIGKVPKPAPVPPFPPSPYP